MKKVLAFAMVLGVLGGILGGCTPPAEGDAAKPAETAGAAGETKTDGE